MRHQNIATVKLSSTLQLRARKHHSKDENSNTEENLTQIDGEGKDSSESAEEDKDDESRSSKEFRTMHNYSDSKSQPFLN